MLKDRARSSFLQANNRFCRAEREHGCLFDEEFPMGSLEIRKWRPCARMTTTLHLEDAVRFLNRSFWEDGDDVRDERNFYC